MVVTAAKISPPYSTLTQDFTDLEWLNMTDHDNLKLQIMENATNTAQSFKDKWEKNTDLAFEHTLRETSDVAQWIIGRNGFGSFDGLRAHLAGCRRILDGGCGNGRVTALLRSLTDPMKTEVVGVDLVASEVARKNLEGQPNVSLHAGDLLGDLGALGKFDFIYCQEVLHHTADPRKGFLNLASLLEQGGELAVYVYKQKAPMREYADDFIRDAIGDLPYDEAMKACEQVTSLGKALSELKVKFTCPAVDVLGIEAGEYDVQRFLYYFFLKCFWSPDFGFHDNAVINYDWYHPQLCTRHTIEEVLGWCADAGLRVVHQCVDPYGITVRAVKDGAAVV
jgi:SAM-dependent methyltransferase